MVCVCVCDGVHPWAAGKMYKCLCGEYVSPAQVMKELAQQGSGPNISQDSARNREIFP